MVTKRGDGSRHRAAHNFRIVELCSSGIRARHQDPADPIPGSALEATLTGLVKARILMQKRRKNGAGCEVLDDSIGNRGSDPLSIGSPALAISRLAVFRLSDRRQKSPPWILHIIERASSYDRIF